jgi:5S rRNA maturation endonuclease (ribonuclease M5)
MAFSADYILRKLQELPPDRKLKIDPDGRRARITCHYHRLPDGNYEKTPSFFVNIQYSGKYKQGSGHCFGCGKSVKDFEAVLDPNWTPEEKPDLYDEDDGSVERLHNTYSDRLLLGDDKPPYDLRAAMEWDPQEDWRGIPGKLMVALGAKMVFDPKMKILMAYLPCMVNGGHVGGVRARLEKRKGSLSYINVEGEWTKDYGLFPYDLTRRLIKKKGLDCVVPVEGPRDALNSLRYGIPALAILGSQNWSDTKAELIYNLGVKRVISAFDPDKAGRLATQKLYASLGDELDVRRFGFEKYMAQIEKETGKPLQESLDPGNMPLFVAEKLRAAVYRRAA